MTNQRKYAWLNGARPLEGVQGNSEIEADADAFRAAMRRLGGAVCVVTTDHDGQKFGLTATAVCSLTATPPRILVCINLSGQSYKLISKSRVMAINVLGSDQHGIASSFANKTGEDLFDNGRWLKGATGAPLLIDSLASFDCEIEQMLVTSTHAIVVGEIRYISYNADPVDTQPLLYVDGEFRTTAKMDPAEIA